jgi:hypothetical protein
MVTVALGHEPTRENLNLWLDRAFKADPNNVEAGHNLLWFLMPRWNGSREMMLAFGRTCLARAKTQQLIAPMGALLLTAHDNVLMEDGPKDESEYAQSQRHQRYWRQAVPAKDVEDIFGWVLQRFPESGYYRSSYACYLVNCGRLKEAREQFRILGDRLAPMAFGSPQTMFRYKQAAIEAAGPEEK